jgi:flavin-dependent dehydrogenase
MPHADAYSSLLKPSSPVPTRWVGDFLRTTTQGDLMRSEFDVVIMGGGPAGATAAILLARGGWSVAVVEKQRFPQRKLSGECIAASNLPLLEALGIGAAIEARGGPELRKVSLMRGVDKVVRDLPASTNDGYRWGRTMARETFDVLLLDQARASGAQVFQPFCAQSVEGTSGHWKVEVSNAVPESFGAQESVRILRSRMLIAANGSWEALPTPVAQGIKVHRASDLLSFKASFRGARLEAGVLPVISLNGGYAGMVLAGDGIMTVTCCIRRDRLSALRQASRGDRAGEVIETWLKHECLGVRETLHGAERVEPWLACGPVEPGFRMNAADGMFRIGNAAGQAHPIIGEGISMELQSAWMLSTQMLRGAVQHPMGGAAWQRAVERRYQKQWRRAFVTRVGLAAILAHLAMHPVTGALLMMLARRWPGLLTMGAAVEGKCTEPTLAHMSMAELGSVPALGHSSR